MLDSTGYSIGRRIFAPGSHNATWHMHTAGQLIFAESGHGRFQIKTGGAPTWSHPIVSNGKLFIRDQDNIYAFDVRQR